MTQEIVMKALILFIMSIFLGGGLLHFLGLFLDNHKTPRLLTRRLIGWREINRAKYRSVLKSIIRSPNYTHKDGRLNEVGAYRESDWDAGCPAWDTFTRQDGDVIEYLQNPRSETALFFLRARKNWYGVRVELMKEGRMKPCLGAKMWSFVTNRRIEFIGQPILVRFYNSGTVKQLQEV